MLKMAESDGVFEVETILGRRYSSDGEIEYLIRWRGYNSDWDTWEPAGNLDSAQEAVEDFNSRIPLSGVMAANRPARTIKPPSKFLDSDLPITNINGVPNHLEVAGNLSSGSVRNFSRSISLTREEGKTKQLPRRRASSIESHGDEDLKSAGKLSRQSSLSPSAKVKPPRKSIADEVEPRNGAISVTTEDDSKPLEMNNVASKAKLSPGTRKQTVLKSKALETSDTTGANSTNDNSQPPKCVKSNLDESVSSPAAKCNAQEMDDGKAKGTKRGNAKSSPIKAPSEDGKNVGANKGAQEVATAPTGKQKGKPGPKPKPKLNTKKLKTVLRKQKVDLAKTPKATAERVKRKYAQKKTSFTATESQTESETGTESSDPATNQASNESTSVPQGSARKPGVKKRQIVKLGAKPAKGKISAKSALKLSKGLKPMTTEASHITNSDSGQKLAVKRPRLKPGPKPKRIKLSNTPDSGAQKNARGESSDRSETSRSSSVDKTVRYKLDGSPCLKPGPKPKKLSESNESATPKATSADVPSGSAGKVTPSKGKPGPKSKRSVNSELSGLASTKQPVATKEEKYPDKKGSPKFKKETATNEIVRKKPGPKPKKKLSESVEFGNADLETKVESSVLGTVLTSGKGKPGPKPKKGLVNSASGIKDSTKTSSKTESTLEQSSNQGRGKPGPKPKTSDSQTEISENPDEISEKGLSSKTKKLKSESEEKIDKGKEKLGSKSKRGESTSKDNVKNELQGSKNKKDLIGAKEGLQLTKLKSTSKAKSAQSNVTNSPGSAKNASKLKTVKSDSNASPSKGKPGPKPKKTLTESSKSSKVLSSPNKTDKESKQVGKKVKKTMKRTANSSSNSSSDESDTLYSLGEVQSKRIKLDHSDSATSSDSEIVIKKPKPVKTSPSPRKMLLKDSIRPKTLDNETDLKKKTHPLENKSPSKSSPPGVFKKMASVTAPGTSQGTQHHQKEVESRLGVYIKDLPTLPVIPNMMPTSPLAASHKTLLKTLNQGKVAASRTRRQPSNSSDEEEGIVERRVSVRQSESAFRYKEIVVKKCPGYTQIWLFTSTKIKNALNPKVFQELREALKNARFDDSKLVMISGSGSIFCSGIDLHYLMDDDRRMAAKKMTDAMKEFVQAVVSFPKPIVAAVNGVAIGLGVAILPLCDIIYASDKASFSCPYSRLAQTPEGCASHTFPSVMGLAMANEMLLGGRKLTAIEAYQIGLVSQVFWPTSMMQEVIPRIQNMASFSSRALEQSKLLMRSSIRAKLDYVLDAECQSLLERWSSTECHRAFRTYLEEEQDLLV